MAPLAGVDLRRGRSGDRHPEQIVLVGILDAHAGEVASLEAVGFVLVVFVVVLRRIGLRAPGRAAFAVGDVDQFVDLATDPGG